MIECILFDMGNTLIDFEPEPFASLHREALGRVHRALAPRVDADGFSDAFASVWGALERRHRPDGRQPHLGDAFRGVLDRLEIPADPGVLTRMEDAHFSVFRERIRLYPEVPRLLDRCRDRGLKLALVSNTIWRSDDHRADLARFGIADAFDHQVYSRDFGWMKPHPSIFRDALDAVGVAPERSVMIGDRLSVDIAGARALGCRTILRRHEHTWEGRDPACVPDAEVDDLADLLERLDALAAQ